METAPLSPEAEAEKWAMGVPRPSYRMARTEKVWFYRAYQGGEPYALIDWRQSGRSDALWVREHEPITKRPLFLWTCTDEENKENLTLLLALARLLIVDERQVSWLCTHPVPTNLISRVEEQCAQSEAEDENAFLLEARLPKRESCLVLAAPFAENEAVWAARLQLFAAQGARGVLIDTSQPHLPTDSLFLTSARNLEWPVLALKEGQRTEELLPPLHAQILRLTL